MRASHSLQAFLANLLGLSMTLNELLTQINSTPELVQFKDVMSVIEQHYRYSPQAFSNGLGEDKVLNAAGSNEGSCKIFAFAQLQSLAVPQTLACFGDFYRKDVLEHPDASDHANIRTFIRDGWAGIQFEEIPLTATPSV